MVAYLFFHLIFDSEDGVGRVHLMQWVYFLKCILELIYRVNLKAKHIATTLKTKGQSVFCLLKAPKADKKCTFDRALNHYILPPVRCILEHVTWRELSITRAKPNFESLILMDHLGGEKAKQYIKCINIGVRDTTWFYGKKSHSNSCVGGTVMSININNLFYLQQPQKNLDLLSAVNQQILTFRKLEPTNV